MTDDSAHPLKESVHAVILIVALESSEYLVECGACRAAWCVRARARALALLVGVFASRHYHCLLPVGRSPGACGVRLVFKYASV